MFRARVRMGVGLCSLVVACGSSDTGGATPAGTGAGGSGGASGSSGKAAGPGGGGASGSSGKAAGPGPGGASGAGAGGIAGASGTGASGAGNGGASGSGGGALPTACTGPAASDGALQQLLPKTYLDTTFPKTTGKNTVVKAGDDLQAAIDAAAPGDTLSLAPGATFKGPITLKAKSGDAVIVIRSGAADSALPAPGTRITPSSAAMLPKITAPNAQPAIQTAAGAHHYRLMGLEVLPESESVQIYELILLEAPMQTTLAQAPHDLVLDRLYVHGFPAGYTKRGVQLGSASTAVIDSYVADCHAEGQDTQAIAGFNGPGPYKIENDYLEGGAENVIFGGADPAIQGLVPADIEITRNHFRKPLTWKVDDPTYAGKHWTVKNLLELKNAERVLVRCNVFDQLWADAQVGFAIVLTPRDQDKTAPWSAVRDVTFVHNLVRHTNNGVNVLGHDDLAPSAQTQRILVQDNLFYDIGGPKWGGSGIFLQVLGDAAGLKVDHVTALHSGTVISIDGDPTKPTTGFVYTNNITPHNMYGVHGSGSGTGTGSLMTWFPAYVFQKNVLFGGDASQYPMGNFFPPTLADVGFVDPSKDDYHLLPTSPFVGAGTDGKDVGADIAGVLAATSGVTSP